MHRFVVLNNLALLTFVTLDLVTLAMSQATTTTVGPSTTTLTTARFGLTSSTTLRAISIEKKQSADPLADVKFCRQLVENCPYLQSRRIRPVRHDSRIHINATLVVTRFIGISELRHRLSIQGQIQFHWNLPPCANWENGTDHVPEVPYCEFDNNNNSIWRPPVTHANQIGQADAMAT